MQGESLPRATVSTPGLTHALVTCGDTVRKQTTHKVHMETSNLKKVNEVLRRG
jgi:hypothetical protein